MIGGGDLGRGRVVGNYYGRSELASDPVTTPAQPPQDSRVERVESHGDETFVGYDGDEIEGIIAGLESTFIAAPDGDDEPTVFVSRQPVWSSQLHPVALFRRCDLPALPDRDEIWDALVARLTADGICYPPGSGPHVVDQATCEHPDWRGDFGDLRAPLGFDRCQRCGLLRCSYCDGKGCPDCVSVIDPFGTR